MSKIIQEITTKGLHLTNTILAQWGWHQGTEVIIEPDDHCIAIRVLRLPAEALSNIAGTYLFENVGDAVATEEPKWDGEKWFVKVTLPSRNKQLGKLIFSADGQIITTESDSPMLLEQRANED